MVVCNIRRKGLIILFPVVPTNTFCGVLVALKKFPLCQRDLVWQIQGETSANISTHCCKDVTARIHLNHDFPLKISVHLFFIDYFPSYKHPFRQGSPTSGCFNPNFRPAPRSSSGPTSAWWSRFFAPGPRPHNLPWHGIQHSSQPLDALGAFTPICLISTARKPANPDRFLLPCFGWF